MAAVKMFRIRKDGGSESNVTGYWLIEWKSVFSVALLAFDKGSREAYHSHAFNCISWVLKGHLEEHRILQDESTQLRTYKASLIPLITKRDNLHKVFGMARRTWVLTFRGPWSDVWKERLPDGREVSLTHGRVQLTDN